MSRPTRRQVQQPTPQYAVVPTQSPTRANSYTSQRPQPSYQQPQPVYQQPQPVYNQSQSIYQNQQTKKPVYQQQQPKPQPHIGGPRPVRSASANSRHSSRGHNGRSAMAMGVATGNIGGSYGPYSYQPEQARETGVYRTNTRFSNAPSSENSHSREHAPPQRPAAPTTTTVPQYLLDKYPDFDDALHNPDPRGDSNFTVFSWRGWVNASAMIFLISALITLFIGYPLMHYYTSLPPRIVGWNVGGINATGQIPVLPNVPSLIDLQTPASALTRIGSDGKLYNLVFSDEFNTDGRSFYPGDDPYWEAADLHYWPTGDGEWYDPSAVTTANGKLVITMTEQMVHNLNFQSGMLTSWNKLCFTTGYIEVSVSLPGSPSAPGLWPGVWTLGNLGRAGYGATTEGMWPYSYDSCDAGTFPGQMKSGQPAAAATGGLGGTVLSTQPGQKLSACTCPGSDHPGPSVNVGRGVPEVDVLEARVDTDKMQGQISQSFQCAPYDLYYNWNTNSSATTIYNSSITAVNAYRGGPLQQSVSAMTLIDDRFYGGQQFSTFGFELWSDPNNRGDGYITWYSNNAKTWTVTSASTGPDSSVGIGQRLISEEPMYIIFNLAIADSFQLPDFKHLVFPTQMYVDYVRVYQRQGTKNGITCDPPNRPTSDYISRHIDAYMNANLTTWAQANATFPRNSLYDGCSN